MDQDEARRRVRRAFRTFPRLADGRHDSEGWRSHDGVHVARMVRLPAAPIRSRLDPCRLALAAHPFVRIHSDDFFHISLQELGFVCHESRCPDEITPGRLEEFAIVAARPMGDRSRLTSSSAA